MLFGNKRSLAVEIQPLAPTWERRYPPEATGWAQFALWVRGRNLCRHLIEGSDRIRESLNLPLGAVADWFVTSWPYFEFEERAASFATADNPYVSLARWGESPPPRDVPEDVWTDAREAWWSRHFLAASGGGSCLPLVSFVRQGEDLVVQWKAGFSGTREHHPLVVEDSAVLSWDELAQTLEEFVRFVSDWYRREGATSAYDWIAAADPLRERALPLLDTLTLFTGRRTEELLGLTAAPDAESLPACLGLPDGSGAPDASPVTQALCDLPPGLPSATGGLLRELDRLTRAKAASARDLPTLRDRARDAAREAESAEEAGYLAAREVRAALGLDGHPVSNARELLCGLGIDLDFMNVLGLNARMIAGARQDGGYAAFVLPSERTTVEWGQRFESARALGHLLLDPWRSGAIGAASSAFAGGLRRRRSGAFAAEFLLPLAALRQATGGVLDAAAEPQVFEGLLRGFGVGARTAAFHLWNHRLLTSEEVRNQLVEDYAATSK